MYYADSDFLTIILAIITFAAAIYSSGKKKGKNGEQGKSKLDKILISEEEIDEEAEMFDEIVNRLKGMGINGEANVETEEIDDDLLQEEPEYDGEEVLADQLKLEREYAEALERMQQVGKEGVSVTSCVAGCVEDDANETDSENKNRLSGIKEIIKKSPKDMILFAEILKPRFKDF